ncbi:MAG TPA: HAMP domain-containing sensor histidine kinase [Nitrososphaeraceae archaeon]
MSVRSDPEQEPKQKKEQINEDKKGKIAHGTRLLQKQQEIAQEIQNVMSMSRDDWSICSTFDGLLMFSNNFMQKEFNNSSYTASVNSNKSSGNLIKLERTRWIGIIDKDRMHLIKSFLEFGMQIRHIQNMPPMNFAVSSEELYATIDEMKDGEMPSSLLITNEPSYVNHYKFIFEELWKKGVDAVDRIRNIEKGIDLAFIEISESPSQTQDLYLNTIKSAKKEILLMFPTVNAFFRQRKIGVIQYTEDAAKKQRIKVKMLMPVYKIAEQKVLYPKQHQNFEIRNIEQTTETKATILIVDRKTLLVMEIKDDSQTTFTQAIGLSTYSNSKAGVLSYVAIFENLWRQAELYEQLKKSNEELAAANRQLQIEGKMQQDFINIAAHELRTPTHSILGYAELLEIEKSKTHKEEYVYPILNNAKRLQRLIDDILDAAKIDNQTLSLQKEQFNLKDIIEDIVEGYDKQIKREQEETVLPWISKRKKGIALDYQPVDIIVVADRNKVSRVISNLLDNAIEFTTEGSITITAVIESTKTDNNKNVVNNSMVTVCIRDSGIGIDEGVFSKLFTKFAFTSKKGTGLGLYISKNIVEAHGGRIWAENNNDGIGSTFYFSLPLGN